MYRCKVEATKNVVRQALASGACDMSGVIAHLRARVGKPLQLESIHAISEAIEELLEAGEVKTVQVGVLELSRVN